MIRNIYFLKNLERPHSYCVAAIATVAFPKKQVIVNFKLPFNLGINKERKKNYFTKIV